MTQSAKNEEIGSIPSPVLPSGYPAGMELFLLALLTAVAALDDNGETRTPKLLPPPRYPDPDEDELNYQKHAVQFWTFMGEPIDLWNDIQEAAWLMGELVCPEGHRADGQNITVGMNAGYHDYPVVPAAPYPALQEGRDNYIFLEKSGITADGTWDDWEALPPFGTCHHPQHQGPQRFALPHRVVDMLRFKRTR